MISPLDKLKVHYVPRGTPEWVRMWGVVRAGEWADYGMDMGKRRPCPFCTPDGVCWCYMGTVYRCHEWVTPEYRRLVPEDILYVHVFMHAAHPREGGRRVIRVVPAVGWEPPEKEATP